MKSDLTAAKKRVTFELTGPIALIQFHHPPVNVFDLQMIDEISEALQAVESHSEVLAVVFGGSRRAFSAGVDVAAHTPDKVAAMLQKFHALIGKLVKYPKVTIAEVSGLC